MVEANKVCLKTKKKLFQHFRGKKWQIKAAKRRTIIVCEQGKQNANKAQMMLDVMKIVIRRDLQ